MLGLGAFIVYGGGGQEDFYFSQEQNWYSLFLQDEIYDPPLFFKFIFQNRWPSPFRTDFAETYKELSAPVLRISS